MPNTKAIRHRIKSVKNTGQITRAMQLVATSKMKRAQEAAIAGQPYILMLGDILNDLAHHLDHFQHPFFERRSVKRRGILVLSTDKGLCGPLNSNLFKEIIKIKDAAAYVTVGRKAAQFLTRTKREVLADFSISDKVQFHEVRTIVQFLSEAYLDGKIDTIEVLFPSFLNTLMQEARLSQVVPILDFRKEMEDFFKRLKMQLSDSHSDKREILIEPSATEILNELPPTYLRQVVYQMLLSAKASEHSARMVAMKSATDNAKSLAEDLTLQYNKARQAAITQEILEIAAATASHGR